MVHNSTNSASPICASARFEPGPSYYNYFCNGYSTFIDVKTSSVRQTTWRAGIPRLVWPASSTFTSNATDSTSSTSRSSVTAQQTSTASAPAASTPVATSASSHKKAIIAGSIGGGLGGLIAFVVLFFVIHSCLAKRRLNMKVPAQSGVLENGFMNYPTN